MPTSWRSVSDSETRVILESRRLKGAFRSRTLGVMTVSKAARHELYNELTKLLGPDQADTLMAYLPEFDPKDVATRSDLADFSTEMRSDMAVFKTEMRSDMAEVKTELSDRFDRLEVRFDGLSARLDRMYQTLVAGLFVIVAAMAGIFFTAL